MKRISALLLATMLASCASQPAPAPPPPRPRPAPVVVAPPPAPVPSNWEDRDFTPGSWAYRRDDRGSVALFGPAGGDALFVARCDAARRQMFLSRSGNFPDGVTGVMTIRASTALKAFPASNSNETPPYVAAAVPVTEPHLDAMAFSRGKFLVAVKGAADLIIPTWPEFARVVEDCR